MIAALYVDPRGVYSELVGVDVWGPDRDARRYRGRSRVVAHPPCERWGRFWRGRPGGPDLALGDDGGCFEHALWAVRTFGGVLEHPECSRAWRAFGLNEPPHSGGWVNADFEGGWTCSVEQGHYGHEAPKPTWLLAYGTPLPSLRWGPSFASGRIEFMCARKRAATPVPFRDLLVELAA